MSATATRTEVTVIIPEVSHITFHCRWDFDEGGYLIVPERAEMVHSDIVNGQRHVALKEKAWRPHWDEFEDCAIEEAEDAIRAWGDALLDVCADDGDPPLTPAEEVAENERLRGEEAWRDYVDGETIAATLRGDLAPDRF